MLKNNALEATFQAGILCSLKDVATGKMLLSIDPEKLPSQLLIFDTEPTDLDACRVAVKASGNSLVTTYQLPDGDELLLRWSVEQGEGDVILQVSSRTAKPIEQIRYALFGCEITDHALVWISGYGAGHVMRAPWNGVQIGDPQKDSIPNGYPHPVVALFQGEKSGWFIEGRDPRTGPSNLLVKGLGNTVDIGMVRKFPIAVPSPRSLRNPHTHL